MATANPFDLLGDDDNDDPSQLLQKIVDAPVKKAQPAAPAGKTAAQPAKPSAKLPSKPLPPAQAVRESRTEGGRGGGGGGGRGYGRGRGGSGGGYNRDPANNNNEGSFGNRGFSGGQGGGEDSDGKSFERRGGGGGGGGGYGGSRGGYRGGRGGSFGNGDSEEGERPRRTYERRSGTGRGNDIKRDGSGRGNWGTQADDINHEIQEAVIEGEKTVAIEKTGAEEEAVDGKKENNANERVEEPENKEMTLEEYQKVLEEKRKALESLKTEERKVEVDKDLASMQQLSNKKTNDDVFVKLGSDKDKRKEIAEREERAKKSLSINEFLKPAEGERYYSPSGGRGRGRGGARGGGAGGSGGGRFNQGGGGGSSYAPEAPKIEDPSHFPTLGGK